MTRARLADRRSTAHLELTRRALLARLAIGLAGVVRTAWRGLTSMRTALMLFFLLAVAALPGALLPQHSLNEANVAAYRHRYPTLGRLLDRWGFFEVFASAWFAAIYLLLATSLVGCLVPRALEYARACRSRPGSTPRNLARLPHHASAVLAGTQEHVLRSVIGRLRGWRVEVRGETVPEAGLGDVTGYSVSAEKGYLREAGNLVFHLALLGLLVALAVGKVWGYEGQVIVMANGDQFCNSGILTYDSFSAGTWVDGTALAPFCLKVDSFAATYLPNGQPVHYEAWIGYQTGDELDAGAQGPWHPYRLEVNSPLRLAGDRVYLLGHGYAPRITVTFPDGTARSQTIQWKPADQTTMLSEGATKFDPPELTDQPARRHEQIAITGLLAPTSSGGTVITSIFPGLLNPEIAMLVYRGDLGLDDGRGQSIFQIDQGQLRSGALTQVARKNLYVGESLTLDNGTTIRFDGVSQWVDLQISHDPAQGFVLAFSLLMLLGLATSLSIKRRRFWARIGPGSATGPQPYVSLDIAGLARTDHAGYGEEFDRIRRELIDDDHRYDDHRECAAADTPDSTDLGDRT